MNSTLQTRCESFIQNKEVIKKTLSWESTYNYPISAAIFTEKGQQADVERLRQCRDLLKGQTGIFSSFRGTVRVPAISMLAVDNNPQYKLQNALKAYDILKGYFFSSNYLVLSAMVIADMVEPERYEEIADRTRTLYNRMKVEHPFLTSSEDSAFAALMALSPLSDDQLVQDMERCYDLLKGQFFSGNAIQSLSHVLALGEGSAEEKCHKTMTLFQTLKNKGYKYGTSYELATLGVLALLPENPEVLAEKMIQVDQYLSHQKDFGIFGVGKRQRLMYAGILVAGEYADQMDQLSLNSAAISSTISLVIAQQVAICSAVAASSAAAASSSSS